MNAHNHHLVLISVDRPNEPTVRLEVGSIQGNYLVLVDGTRPQSYFPQFHVRVFGFPFGAKLDAYRRVVTAPDWSEEIANGLENRTVLGEESA